MRSAAALLVAVLATLVVAASARAAVTAAPVVQLPDYTKADAPSAVDEQVPVTFTFTPPVFSPTSAMDSQSSALRSFDGGGSLTGTMTAGAGVLSTLPYNGHQYLVTVSACENADTLGCFGITATREGNDITRIDASPPAGTVAINDGAPFTNRPDVTLTMAATDPLIAGIPGSSSGVSQYALDEDGDGSFPCATFGDSSGCARSFAPSLPFTLSGGDGIKSVGVVFGDGAREGTAPCVGRFCVRLPAPILGNASPVVTASIMLDTTRPTAVVTQDRFAVSRGGSVALDSAASVDPGSASGVDPTRAIWDFHDGSAPVTATRVSHVFTRTGTFVGTLTIRDRAGNLSDPRSFAVTVTEPPGSAGAGGGSAVGIAGTAAFSLRSIHVSAHYAASRLRGMVLFTGTSTAAGPLGVEIRRTSNGRRLALVHLPALAIGDFRRSVRLPSNLVPGSYRLALVGPGGALSSTLRLTAPREGVASSARLRGRVARFVMAARPTAGLRRSLSVRWSEGGHLLAVEHASAGRTIHAALPEKVLLRRGTLSATLRAGKTVVGTATRRVR